jgi:predicted transcriptional regulator
LFTFTTEAEAVSDLTETLVNISVSTAKNVIEKLGKSGISINAKDSICG